MKKWLKTIGYITLLTSLFIWLAIAIVPFLGYSKGQVAGIITGLIIAGEITFYLGIALLGKTIYLAQKQKLMFWKPKTAEPKPAEGLSENEIEQRTEKF
jgi:hypothetical protein